MIKVAYCNCGTIAGSTDDGVAGAPYIPILIGTLMGCCKLYTDPDGSTERRFCCKYIFLKNLKFASN